MTNCIICPPRLEVGHSIGIAAHLNMQTESRDLPAAHCACSEMGRHLCWPAASAAARAAAATSQSKRDEHWAGAWPVWASASLAISQPAPVRTTWPSSPTLQVCCKAAAPAMSAVQDQGNPSTASNGWQVTSSRPGRVNTCGQEHCRSAGVRLHLVQSRSCTKPTCSDVPFVLSRMLELYIGRERSA